jgi:hypothetical protein
MAHLMIVYGVIDIVDLAFPETGSMFITYVRKHIWLDDS